MGKYLEDVVGEGPLATFLGFWSVMGVYLFYKINVHYSPCGTSDCTVCLQWHRTRGFTCLCNLEVVSTFIQIGVTVGEAENPRRNVPKGAAATNFPCVPTNSDSQPYEEVRQRNYAR